MTIRNPRTDGQLTSGDPEGRRSCVAYSYCYAISHATHGRLSPTGRKIREWTGDTSGGLELTQVDRAVTEHTDLEPITDVFTRSEFWDHVNHGYDAVLIGGYSPIERTRFSGQPGFRLNHGIWVPALSKDGDPLADARRAGIYGYKAEAYGYSLTNDFAAHLRLSDGSLAGPNHFEASLIRVEKSVADVVPSEYEITIDKTDRLRVYDVDFVHKKILGWRNDHPLYETRGFTATSTGRQRFRLSDGRTRYLARVLSGSHGDAKLGVRNGYWVPVEAPYSHLRRAA